MFSGIVQSVGRVESVKEENGGRTLWLTPNLEREWKEGESVLISGICTTVAATNQELICCFYMPETLAKTTAASWKAGDRVNIEPSLKLGDEVSGHFVFGHVDGKAAIQKIEERGGARSMLFGIPAGLSRYFVSKGTVAVDGTSLTVVAPSEDTFQVSLIPYTLEHTTLGQKKEGEEVNIEVDMLAKYVERILAAAP